MLLSRKWGNLLRYTETGVIITSLQTTELILRRDGSIVANLNSIQLSDEDLPARSIMKCKVANVDIMLSILGRKIIMFDWVCQDFPFALAKYLSKRHGKHKYFGYTSMTCSFQQQNPSSSPLL
jgi:hypothetical protein